MPKVTRTLIPHDTTSRDIDGSVQERLKFERALNNLVLTTLERLNLDLIVTQALRDDCAVAESEVTVAACSLLGQPKVVNLEPACLEEVFDCIRLVGSAPCVASKSVEVIARLLDRVELVEKIRRIECCPRVVLLEWTDPQFFLGLQSKSCKSRFVRCLPIFGKFGHGTLSKRIDFSQDHLCKNPHVIPC